MTGTLIHYYLFCKRICYLHAKNITCEDNSQLVKIGKYYHEERNKQKNMKNQKTEIAIENIKIDQIDKKYVTEFKKRNSDLKATKFQLLYYLYILNKHGIKRKGIIKFKESTKKYTVELTNKNKKLIMQTIKEIKELLKQPIPPPPTNSKKCKNCAYYEFCYC